MIGNGRFRSAMCAPDDKETPQLMLITMIVDWSAQELPT
jgi:hypothetical protein